jgi:MFS family permease
MRRPAAAMPAPEPARPGWSQALARLGPIPRTLAHRDFGLYIAGNSVSLIGTWMQRIAVGWLAWELSRSGAVLGLVAFCDLFPAVVIGPFGGVLADRMSRKRLIMIAQSLIMAQAIVLFALTAAGLITVELLLALVLFGGAVIGLNQPARLALVPSLVPRSELATAVAINAIVFNLARFIGPALAGVVIVTAGVAWVFALNALSFIAFLLALAQLRIPPMAAPAGARPSMIEAIGEGLGYTARHPGIAPILLLHLVIAAAARPFVELLPGFAAAVFDRGPAGLAILGSTVGIGAILGGLWLAQRRDGSRLTELTLLHSLVVALAVLGFALSGPFALAVGFVAVAGFAMVASGAGTQTVLQTAVEEGMRGRVLSLFGLIFRGGPALGALVMGAVSEVTGLRAPLIAGTLLAALFWLRLWRRRRALAASLDHPGEVAPALGQGQRP